MPPLTVRASRRTGRIIKEAIDNEKVDVFEDVFRFSARANRRFTPVKTGRLRRSHSSAIVRMNVEQHWGAFYASWVNARGRSKGFADRVNRDVERSLQREYD